LEAKIYILENPFLTSKNTFRNAFSNSENAFRNVIFCLGKHLFQMQPSTRNWKHPPTDRSLCLGRKNLTWMTNIQSKNWSITEIMKKKKRNYLPWQHSHYDSQRQHRFHPSQVHLLLSSSNYLFLHTLPFFLFFFTYWASFFNWKDGHSPPRRPATTPPPSLSPNLIYNKFTEALKSFSVSDKMQKINNGVQEAIAV